MKLLERDIMKLYFENHQNYELKKTFLNELNFYIMLFRTLEMKKLILQQKK
jgi:hypothetical protein